MTFKEIERRLETTEKALNAALKEIEYLKISKTNKTNKTKQLDRSMKDVISPEIFEYLFDYSCDKETGLPCSADTEKKYRNYSNLYKNILMACGYSYPYFNSTNCAYFLKSSPIKAIPEDEFKDFCKLLQEVTSLIYSFKLGRPKEENSGKI